jgi:hypothetical protein
MKKTILNSIGITLVLIFGLFMGYLIPDGILPNSQETISVHKYNELVSHLKYSQLKNYVRGFIAQEQQFGKEDEEFLQSISYHIWRTDSTYHQIPQTKKELVELLDSFAINWYETIPFMFMDERHDSTWVYQSDSYKRMQETVSMIKNYD